MSSPNPLKPWAPRVPVDHQRLNAGEARAITDITVGPGLTVTRNGNSASIGLGEQRRNPFTIFRAIVTADAATVADQGLIKAKLTDATGLAATGPEYFVRPARNGLAVDDELYVARPWPNTIDFEALDVNNLPILQEFIGIMPLSYTPVSIGSTGETEAADGTSVEDAETKAVQDTRLVRMAYNHAGDKKLYGYYRIYTYTGGLLTNISAETRVEVDPAEAC